MVFKVIYVMLLSVFLLFNSVAAEEVQFHTLFMVTAGSSKSIFADGNKYEIKYLSSNAANMEFCLADMLGATKCYQIKKTKDIEVPQYEFCFSSGECIKFKVLEFNEKYLNIETVMFKK